MRIALWLSLLVALALILACGTPTATPTELPLTETQEQSPSTPAEQSATGTPEPTTATSTRPPLTDTPKPTAAPPAEPPAAITAGPAATEVSERPAATPAEQPATDSTSNDPSALLAMLPAGASQFTFVNLEAAMERPAFRDVVELQLSHFVNLDEIPLAEELLRSTHVSAIVMGDFYTRFEWACILSGDFALVQGALRLAASVDSGGGLSAGMIDAHRGRGNLLPRQKDASFGNPSVSGHSGP